LKAGKSGIVASEEMAEHGFRSQVAGTLKIDPKEHIDKRVMRFMGPGAAYAHIAMSQAIADSGLEKKTLLTRAPVWSQVLAALQRHPCWQRIRLF
jgi:3-oxoacyl-[acyl-carrier-protein] synthase-1